MDNRTALQAGAILKLDREYKIEGELARGGSGIVYNASYEDTLGQRKRVRIKECYPLGVHITREESGSLTVSERDRESFQLAQDRMQHAYTSGNTLELTTGLTNFISTTYDFGTANGTVYSISRYGEGRTLAYLEDRSVTNCLTILKSVAETIGKLHEQGFLYLDLKPDNIFVPEGSAGQIELFDFDTVLPIEENARRQYAEKYPVYYTEGFAAREQRQGWQTVGTYSDVYGIGAVLFWILFGKTPDVHDGESDASYEYEKSVILTEAYHPRFYQKLTRFFHQTLARSPKERESDMEHIVSWLGEMEALSKDARLVLQSTNMRRPARLFGREQELQALQSWYDASQSPALFVTGMSGIGKTTLVQAFATQVQEQGETVVFVSYHRSIAHTVTNDWNVRIDDVQRTEANGKNSGETEQDYFVRKLEYLRQIAEKEPVLFVMDGILEDTSEELQALLKLHWKLLLISDTMRETLLPDVASLEVGEIAEEEALYQLFTAALGSRRRLYPEECAEAAKLFQAVGRHTYAIELIASQVRASHLTVASAVQLVKKHGFSDMAPEVLNRRQETIQSVIRSLFDVASLNGEKRRILQLVALCSGQKITVELLSKMLGLRTKNMLNELIEQRFLEYEELEVWVHPVVQETILQEAWTVGELKQAASVFRFFTNELPKKKQEKSFDSQEYRRMLELAEAMTTCAMRIPELSEQQECAELEYEVICGMERTREDYLTERARALLEENRITASWRRMNLYEILVETEIQRDDYDAALTEIAKMKTEVEASTSDYIHGRYCEIFGQYAEHLAFQEQREFTKEMEDFLCKTIFEMSKRAIEYFDRSKMADSVKRGMYERQGLLNYEIRYEENRFRRWRMIKRLRREIQAAMQQERIASDPQLELAYWLGEACYYANIEKRGDIREMVLACLEKAEQAEKRRHLSELDWIDDICIPKAVNTRAMGAFELAEQYLKEGIQICEEHLDEVPYQRKKGELERDLEDLYSEMKNAGVDRLF